MTILNNDLCDCLMRVAMTIIINHNHHCSSWNLREAPNKGKGRSFGLRLCWQVGGAAGVGGDVVSLLVRFIASWLVAVVEGDVPGKSELIVLLVVEGLTNDIN